MASADPIRLYASSIHLTRQEPWARQVRWAGALGFAGVEVFGCELAESVESSAAAICGLRESADRQGLTLTAHPWFDWSGLEIVEAVSRLRELLARCRILGIRTINLHLNFLAGPAEKGARAAAIVRPLLDTLLANGQILLFENVPDYLDNPYGSKPGEFLEFFALLEQHLNVGFNLDVGHAQITRNLGQFIRTLAKYWRYAHLSDNGGQTDEHLAPGMGTVDWPGFLRAAEAVGYGGPFILEFPERLLSRAESCLAPAFAAVGRTWPAVTFQRARLD